MWTVSHLEVDTVSRVSRQKRLGAGALRSDGPGVRAWLGHYLDTLKKVTFSKPGFSYLSKGDS